MAPSTAAKALRDSFGDRKLPDISRRITACVQCRKLKVSEELHGLWVKLEGCKIVLTLLKIKCQIPNSKPPCARCKARGTQCTINKSLQTLLEDDATWKERMESRLATLETAFSQSPSEVVPRVPTTNFPSETPTSIHSGQTRSRFQANNDGSSTANTPALNLQCSLGAFPATSVAEEAQYHDNTHADRSEPDVVTSNILGAEAADEHLAYFKKQCNGYLHDIIRSDESLSDLHSRSSILVDAIMAVTTRCLQSTQHSSCLNSFKSKVSSLFFSTSYNSDDVRALCIGSLWLRELASHLCGLAVRVASQLQLHRCITKAPHAKPECYDRTRLWYQISLCDHHVSIIHGRPPMAQEWSSLASPSQLIRGQHSNCKDFSLISQVELWYEIRRIFENFGADVERGLTGQRYSTFEQLKTSIDACQTRWSHFLGYGINDRDNREHHLWPKHVYDFYHYSAKLYLFSHRFRGRDVASTAPELTESNNEAFLTALSVIDCALEAENTDIWLESVPSFVRTMLTFALLWTVKLSSDEFDPDGTRREESFAKLAKIAALLKKTCTTGSGTTLFAGLAQSIDEYLQNSNGRPNDHNHWTGESRPDLGIIPDDFLNLDWSSGAFDEIWNFLPTEH